MAQRSVLYPDSRPSPTSFPQSPQAMSATTPMQEAASQARRPQSPKSPQQTIRMQRPVNDMSQFFNAVEQAVVFQAPQEIWNSIVGAFKVFNIQLDAWAGDLNQHAQALEAYRTPFYHATVAVKQLENKENELSTSAALKFVLLDAEVAEVRQYLQKQEHKKQRDL